MYCRNRACCVGIKNDHNTNLNSLRPDSVDKISVIFTIYLQESSTCVVDPTTESRQFFIWPASCFLKALVELRIATLALCWTHNVKKNEFLWIVKLYGMQFTILLFSRKHICFEVSWRPHDHGRVERTPWPWVFQWQKERSKSFARSQVQASWEICLRLKILVTFKHG